MNCYEKVIGRLGLTHESQGRAGWVYLILSALADVDATPDTYRNPFREVLHRLSGYEDHALYELAQLFGARADD